ncbi:MAG: sugar phosphate isomerase/epimerase [Gemmataceae bacterium]
MFACLSQVTLLSTPLAQDVAAAAQGGFSAVEVWLTKLETYLESATVAQTASLFADHGLRIVAAAYQGGLLQSQGEARTAHLDHFKRRLDLCQALKIPVLLVLADFTERVDPTAAQRAVVSLKQAAQWAQAFDVALAIEFRSRSSFCTCLPTTLTLLEAADEPNLGVCLDLFHFYTGPSKWEDLALLRPEQLLHVQVCDLAGVARELATDADRIFPGEGDFHLEPLFRYLTQQGYQRAVSLELMNPDLWKAQPATVTQLGHSALQRLLHPGA